MLRKSGRLSDSEPDSAVWEKLARTTLDGIDVAPIGGTLTPAKADERGWGWQVKASINPATPRPFYNKAKELLFQDKQITSYTIGHSEQDPEIIRAREAAQRRHPQQEPVLDGVEIRRGRHPPPAVRKVAPAVPGDRCRDVKALPAEAREPPGDALQPRGRRRAIEYHEQALMIAREIGYPVIDIGADLPAAFRDPGPPAKVIPVDEATVTENSARWIEDATMAGVIRRHVFAASMAEHRIHARQEPR